MPMPSRSKAGEKRNKTKLWERQPWDTDTSYANFHTYYLSQKAGKRTLAEAYRRYRRAKGYEEVEVSPPGGWNKWYYGQDSKGRNLPGSVYANAIPWKKRAEAYDDVMYRGEQTDWAEKRRQEIANLVLAERKKTPKADHVFGLEHLKLALQEDLRILADAYLTGVPLKKLAAQYHTSSAALSALLRKAGLPSRRLNEMRETIFKEYQAGKEVAQLAAAYKTNEEQILRLFAYYEITQPSPTL